MSNVVVWRALDERPTVSRSVSAMERRQMAVAACRATIVAVLLPRHASGPRLMVVFGNQYSRVAVEAVDWAATSAVATSSWTTSRAARFWILLPTLKVTARGLGYHPVVGWGSHRAPDWGCHCAA